MLTVVRFWILLSTLLVSDGWILSVFHQLNYAGYGIVFLLSAAAGLLWRQRSGWDPRNRLAGMLHKIRRRFRRPAPLMFGLLALLAFCSGALLPDLNYDTNAYRLPRVLHWLSSGQWHWIRTSDARMNIVGCNSEWLSAPLVLFMGNCRWIFLGNWISYLLLPGLIFSVFTRMGVRPRVAWWWMWWLSAGWCFALQAASTDCDSLAAVYILAAADLALRAGQKNSAVDLCLSLLAAALATGVKQTNLPPLLLWLLAAWPARRLFRARPWGTALTVCVALLISALPVSIMNFEHYGTWIPSDGPGLPSGKFQLNPFWGVIGNAFCLPLQNLMPPFHEWLPPYFRYSVQLWNEYMRHFVLTPFGAHFSSFENFGYLSAAYYRGICEGNAGLGLGVCIMVLVTLAKMWGLRKERQAVAFTRSKTVSIFWLRVAPWALLLLFMAKVGTFSNARHLAPYYLFLFPAFLVQPGHALIVRGPHWQQRGLVIMGLAVLVMAGAGNRPILPLPSICDWLHKKFPGNELFADQARRYAESDYHAAEGRKTFIAHTLPSNEMVVGYYPQFCDGDEPALWLPFGHRRVECISPGDSPEFLRSLGIHYAVVHLGPLDGSIADWMSKYNAALAGQCAFPYAQIGPYELYLVRLN